MLIFYKRISKNNKLLSYHRYVWEKYNGKIPDGMVIHHINEDIHDNKIENLRLMSVSEHAILHGKKRKKDKKYTQSKRNKIRKEIFGKYKCPYCKMRMDNMKANKRISHKLNCLK